MQKISSADLIRNFGKHSDVALTEPVLITKNGRERLVLLGAEEYNVLLQIKDSHEDAQEARARRRSAGRQDEGDRRKAGRTTRSKR